VNLLARAGFDDESEWRLYNKIASRLLPFMVLLYVISFLDRVNIGFAKLRMASDIGLSDAVYGFGAGVFFVAYCICEIPSNLILARVGARIWIARIMLLWGLVSAGMMFVTSPVEFYVMRVLLGVAEAGFFPGIILYLTYWFPVRQRSQAISYFLLDIALAGVIGGPFSGWLMQTFDRQGGMHGWQWLFLIEGIPAVLSGTAAAAGIGMISMIGNAGGYIFPFGIGWLREVSGRPEYGLFLLAIASFIGALVMLRIQKV
jgi:MFS family permease